GGAGNRLLAQDRHDLQYGRARQCARAKLRLAVTVAHRPCPFRASKHPMDDCCLKFSTVGTGPGARRIAVRARAALASEASGRRGAAARPTPRMARAWRAWC